MEPFSGLYWARTVNSAFSHICLVLYRMTLPELVLGTVLLVASALTVLAAANTPPHITSLTASSSFIDEGQSITVNGTFTEVADSLRG